MFSTSVVHTSFPPWKPMRTWRGTAVQQGEVDKLSGPSLSWRGTAAQGAVQWTCHPPPSPGRVHCLTPHHTSPHYRTPSHTECATPHVRTGLNTVEMHDCISLSVRMFSCEGKTGCGGSGVGRGVYTITVPSCTSTRLVRPTAISHPQSGFLGVVVATLPTSSTYPETHLCQAVELTAADVPLLVPPLERPALQNRNPDAPGSQRGGGNDAQSPAQVWRGVCVGGAPEPQTGCPEQPVRWQR